MPIDLGTGRYLVLAADLDTPDDMLPYVGRIIPIPDDLVLPTGQDSITWNGVTYWGFVRAGATGDTEWVMSAAQNPNLVALDQLPGPDGWLVPESRNTVLMIGRQLLRSGLTGAELRPAMQQVYSAIVAERDAQILAAGGSLGGTS
jgi:hypothetical protein